MTPASLNQIIEKLREKSRAAQLPDPQVVREHAYQAQLATRRSQLGRRFLVIELGCTLLAVTVLFTAAGPLVR